MAYCGPRGIPLEEFLQWGELSQDAALQWQAYEARRCSSCGSHPDEGPRHAHVDVCAGCVARAHADESEDAKARGAHVRMAAGTAGTCERCLKEIRLNRPT